MLFPQARDALMCTVVPENLGFEAVTREDIRTKHTTELANGIFLDGDTTSDNIILVADGTYIYIEKSKDYAFARSSYSVHKGRPLVKPMMLVTTTG